MSERSDRYEADYYAWTADQADALREMAKLRVNTPLDLEHLAEEVSDLGSAQRDAVLSQIQRIIEHSLKLEYSAASDPRMDWKESILDARDALDRKITPTLRREAAAELPDLYHRARRKAAVGLIKFKETDAAAALPEQCPYAFDELVGSSWYPVNRHGIVDPELPD